MADIKISPLKEEDIQGAITTIQEAFANDPYNLWVYNDRSKVKYSLFFHFPFYYSVPMFLICS